MKNADLERRAKSTDLFVASLRRQQRVMTMRQFLRRATLFALATAPFVLGSCNDPPSDKGGGGAGGSDTEFPPHAEKP